MRFSPNGDGVNDRLRVHRSLSERATIRVQVRNKKGEVVRSFSRAARRGSGSITWDGRDRRGNIVRDGTYNLSFTPRDKSGNKGETRRIRARVLTTVKSTRQRGKALFAADRDRYARASKVSFTLVRRARVSWVVRDQGGRTVLTHSRTSRSARAASLVLGWPRPEGQLRQVRQVPHGHHRPHLGRHRSGDATIQVGAFRIATSDATPKRGQRIRIRVYYHRALKSAPSSGSASPGPGIEP